MQRKSLSIGTVALAVVCGVTQAQEGKTSFLHFGELDRQLVGRSKQCDFEFTLWDAPEGGERIGRTLIYDGWETNKARVPVDDGYFEVVLDFGVEIYDDEPVYVESRRACGRNAKWATVSRVVVTEDLLVEDDRLTVVETPIERVTPSRSSRPTRIDESAGTFNNTLEAADGDPSPAVEVDADGNTSMVGDLTVGGAIKIDGDNNPLEIHVNGVRALRFEYADALSEAPNVIGGSPSNSVVPQKAGAVIAGGGSATAPNQVAEDWGTVSGGKGNEAFGMLGTVSGGSGNTAMGAGSTVSGGQDGTAGGMFSVVGGGAGNLAGGDNSVVTGGTGNTANGPQSAIGGGEQNTAAGTNAVVPGGMANAATGDFSMAAGKRAKALHLGSFVWGDSAAADWASTGNNQFLIRAGGGVGIGTTLSSTPGARLTVAGAPGTNDGREANTELVLKGDSPQIRFSDTDAAQKNWWIHANGGSLFFLDESDVAAADTWDPARRPLTLASDGKVGIGTSIPAEDFHVWRPDNDVARIYATGSAQGAGMVYVGQSTVFGGGIAYDGDAGPDIVGGNDRVTLFRRNNGTDADVMSYAFSSNNVIFTGNVNAPSVTTSGNVSVGGNISFGSASGFTLLGPVTAEKHNSAGVDDVLLISTAKAFCSLSMMDVEDTDSVGERARCIVFVFSGNWWLRAQLFQNNDADVICRAYCLRWD